MADLRALVRSHARLTLLLLALALAVKAVVPNRRNLAPWVVLAMPDGPAQIRCCWQRQSPSLS